MMITAKALKAQFQLPSPLASLTENPNTVGRFPEGW